RRRPNVTLFPRAALFRSGVLGVLARVRLAEIENGEMANAFDETGRRAAALLEERERAQAALADEVVEAERVLRELEVQRAEQLADRKSTRLNSSHVKISY